MKVTIVKVDPYHKIFGLLVPELVQRLTESLQALGDETGAVLLNFMPRLWARDTGALLLAAVDEKGHVKGHVAAFFQETQEAGRQVVLIQPRLDEPAENDAVAEMLAEVEKWAKVLNAGELMLVSKRFDSKWAKKHGFEIARYILTKAVG